MQIIAHRGLWKNRAEPNSLGAIEAAFASGFGVETDVRSFEGKLYLSHDAIIDPRRPARMDDFLQLAKKFPKAPVFLNIKEDGLVTLLSGFREQFDQCQVAFFDMSVPQLVQFAKVFPPSQLSTRFSEFETVPSGLEWCDWIWVDAFKKDLQGNDVIKLCSSYQKKLAFVSPELHGRGEKDFWNALRVTKTAENANHAICTDFPAECLQELES